MEFDTKVRGATQLVEWNIIVKTTPIAVQIINSFPLRYAPSVTISNPADLVTRQYVDSIAFAGGVPDRTIDKFVPETNGEQDFTLTTAPRDNSLVDVFINGLLMEEVQDYTLTAAVLHVNNTTLETTDKIIVKYW